MTSRYAGNRSYSLLLEEQPRASRMHSKCTLIMLPLNFNSLPGTLPMHMSGERKPPQGDRTLRMHGFAEVSAEVLGGSADYPIIK